MVEMIHSFDELCRLCANKVDVLMGLDIFSTDHRQILKKIHVCLPIEVNAGDNLPKLVCVECACKLDLLFDFRERSVLTAHLFTDMLTVNNEMVVAKEVADAVEVSQGFVSEEYLECVNGSIKLETLEVTNDIETNIQVNVIDKDSCNKPDEKLILPIIIKLNSNHKKMDKLNVLDNNILQQGDDKSLIYEETNEIIDSFEHNVDICVQGKEIFSENKKIETILCDNQQILEQARLEDVNNDMEDENTEWYYCKVCGKTYTNKIQYKIHCNEHYYICECGSKFMSEETLKKHKLEKHKKKTKRKKKLNNENLPNVKKTELKTCSECSKQFQTNYKLQEHMRKHTGERPFSCSYKNCFKTFRSKIGLTEHEANHSGQFEFSCNTCGKGFHSKSYLVVHQRVHSDIKPFNCKQCSHKFKTKQSLMDHMNRHLGVKPYLCDICGKGFITKGLCKSHQKVHSGADNRQYPCHVCRKLFVSKSYLNTHFRIHTGEKPFMCEVCGKGFLTKVDLKIHATVHTGEKRFVCETCGKAFARRDALRCHRRSHTGERPYKCDFCGQSFTQFSPMQIHKRLHTGERPYCCNVCSKTFVSRSSMLAHRKKHHLNNEDTCDYKIVEVEIQPDTLLQDEHLSEQLVVIEETTPQVLSALNKSIIPTGTTTTTATTMIVRDEDNNCDVVDIDD